jgi:hypothetical protein
MDSLTYRTDAISEEIHTAADEAAAQCGYDQMEEVLLATEILNIRMISAESVHRLYSEWLEPPCSYSVDEIVRVDWRTWSVPKRFNGHYAASVIERVESIVVDLPTLLAGEVFTYGLGPEYNWIDWKDGDSLNGELPSSVFEALCDLIKGDWSEDVREDAESDDEYISHIHPNLQAAVAHTLGLGKSSP